MKKILAVFALLTLTGCAAPFELYAHYLNTQDPCQARNNGGTYPSWCGAGGSRSIIYNRNSGEVGYIKNKN